GRYCATVYATKVAPLEPRVPAPCQYAAEDLPGRNRYRDRMYVRTRVSLTAFVRGTDSGAATFLGLASDGNAYWIKAPNNPQGSRSLIPERVVTHIGMVIGAPVRPIALVDIPDGMKVSYRPGYPLR